MSTQNNFEILPAFDEDGDIDPDFGEAAEKIAKDRDLGITRDRELQFVAMLDEDVVGAAWVAFDNKNYEFDVAVARGFDRKGIGKALVKAVVSERDFICVQCEEMDRATMLVPVTSLAMCRLLENQGFVITDMPAKGFVTMGPKDECEPYQSNECSPDDYSNSFTP